MLNVTNQKPRRKSGFFYAREFLEESLPGRWVGQTLLAQTDEVLEDALDAPGRRPISISTWTCK